MAGTTVALLTSIAGAAATSLLAPKPPKTPKPVPMPNEDATNAAARRKSIMEQQQRQGRASTILTDNTSDTLG